MPIASILAFGRNNEMTRLRNESIDKFRCSFEMIQRYFNITT